MGVFLIFVLEVDLGGFVVEDVGLKDVEIFVDVVEFELDVIFDVLKVELECKIDVDCGFGGCIDG